MAEAEIVDLAQLRERMRRERAEEILGGPADDVSSGLAAERARLANRKFDDVLERFVRRGCKAQEMPAFVLSVSFRDHVLTRPLRERLSKFRRMGMIVERIGYGRAYAGPKEGPLGELALSPEAAADIFSRRAELDVAALYGAYRRSRHGFRTVVEEVHSDEGVGFSVVLVAEEIESHVIDDEKDLRDALRVFRESHRLLSGSEPSAPRLTVVRDPEADPGMKRP